MKFILPSSSSSKVYVFVDEIDKSGSSSMGYDPNHKTQDKKEKKNMKMKNGIMMNGS